MGAFVFQKGRYVKRNHKKEKGGAQRAERASNVGREDREQEGESKGWIGIARTPKKKKSFQPLTYPMFTTLGGLGLRLVRVEVGGF